MQYSRLLLINGLMPALLGMVSPAQHIVDDWTLFFDGLIGSAIVMHSLQSFDSLCETADEQLFVKILRHLQL